VSSDETIQLEVRPSCSSSTALASVITAIATALLATVIFVLVQIAVCKCHPNFTPGGAGAGTSAGGEDGGVSETGEEREYEVMDEGKEGGKATGYPTYMEVGDRDGGRSTILLQENEAYAISTN
jgi:hypothetical protein